MNSQTKKDIPCFRSYLPDALRLRFEDKLTIRAIAQRLGLSHSTIHTLFQRFIASGIAWPLPDSVSLAQLDAIRLVKIVLSGNNRAHLYRWTRTMNSQTKKDIPCFRSYLPDALRLRFEDKLTIRAIAQRLGLSHSTIHTLFQRFIASGIAWPLPDSVSLAQLDAILYANRKKELTEPQISEGTWRKERRASYSREFKVRLAKQALQPGAVVARIAREHGINDNLLFKWKSQYEDGLLSDDDIQECMPVPVALTDTPEPTRPVTNPFWRNKPDECPESDPGNVPRCELHLKSGVVAGITDMRCGFNGLASKVQNTLKDDPFSGHIFVFRGRSGKMVKILWADRDGLCLFAKRLERGRFVWPVTREGKVHLTPAQLSMLLEGIAWQHPKRTERPGIRI